MGSPECLLPPAHPHVHSLMCSHRKALSSSFKKKDKSVEISISCLYPPTGNLYFSGDETATNLKTMVAAGR